MKALPGHEVYTLTPDQLKAVADRDRAAAEGSGPRP